MKRLRTFLLLLLLPFAACGSSSKPIEGRVVDAETKKPLAGAIVIGRWNKTQSILMADSRTYCAHVETATTDGEGRYRMPQWEGKPPLNLDAYQPGYETYWPAGYGSTEDFKNNVLYLAPFKGTKEERLRNLKRVDEGTQCPDAGGTRKKLLPLQEAIYNEARTVAADTGPDRRILEILLFGIESERFGSMEALKRMDARRRMVGELPDTTNPK